MTLCAKNPAARHASVLIRSGMPRSAEEASFPHLHLNFVKSIIRCRVGRLTLPQTQVHGLASRLLRKPRRMIGGMTWFIEIRCVTHTNSNSQRYYERIATIPELIPNKRNNSIQIVKTGSTTGTKPMCSFHLIKYHSKNMFI